MTRRQLWAKKNQNERGRQIWPGQSDNVDKFNEKHHSEPHRETRHSRCSRASDLVLVTAHGVETTSGVKRKWEAPIERVCGNL